MDLFDDTPQPPKSRRRTSANKVVPVTPAHEVCKLAIDLPATLRLGTSSWSFPGWNRLVWDGDYSESTLSKFGLPAYAQHPALRTVSLDRAFYKPLSASQYAAYAAQVPPDFRFVVKAPSLVTDAMVRGNDGRGMQANPAFLNPELAASEFVEPALEGLASRIGALVLQLSPLPSAWLVRKADFLDRLATLLRGLPSLKPLAPDGVIAVEVRNPELLGPELANVLKAAGATYCLGLHAKMPSIEEQLPMLRALWPGPLVCRWNLHRKHGAYGYEEARNSYEPFDMLVDPDPDTRAQLARVIAATTAAGHNAFVTINNKAEGSAPLSVFELARAVLEKTATPRRPTA